MERATENDFGSVMLRSLSATSMVIESSAYPSGHSVRWMVTGFWF